jgi:regulatory factor X
LFNPTASGVADHLRLAPLSPCAAFPNSDCGIRPATSAEAEWLQDYIRKSNNTAAQQSVNAARLASEHAESSHRGGGGLGDDRSDDEDEDDSEGASSGHASNRNSFVLPNGLKSPVLYHEELSDKTPTAANLLADAQIGPRGRPFPTQATIRRHPGQDAALSLQPGLPSTPFTSPSQPTTSVRQMPHFPSIEDALGSSASNSSHAVAARELWAWFLDHLDSLLESVRYFRFDQFEMQVRTFWANLQGPHREVAHAPAIAGLMAKGDAIMYDVRSASGSCSHSAAPSV